MLDVQKKKCEKKFNIFMTSKLIFDGLPPMFPHQKVFGLVD